MIDDTVDNVSKYLKAKQSALEGLLASIEKNLAALTATIGDKNNETLSAIETALADVASTLDGSKVFEAIEAATRAIEGLELKVDVEQKAPVVNVQVNPTPVTVEAVMPASPAPVIHNEIKFPEQKGATWEVVIPGGGYGGKDRVMTIIRKS